MPRSTTAGAVLTFTAAVAGCGGTPPAADPAPDITSRTEVARVARGANALEGFQPTHEAVVEGGECHEMALPKAGVRRLSVFFPSLAEPATVLTLVVDSDGTVVRYSETRGLDVTRRSRRGDAPDLLDWTTLSLDYVTGEAMVSDDAAAPDGGLMTTSVAKVVESGAFGDLEDRVERAKRVCALRTGAVPDTGGEPPLIAIHRAWAEERPGTPPIVHDGRTFHMDVEPVITDRHIAGAELFENLGRLRIAFATRRPNRGRRNRRDPAPGQGGRQSGAGRAEGPGPAAGRLQPRCRL